MTLRLPKTVRSIQRVQTIARVLTAHGFGHLVDRLHLARYVPLPRRWRGPIPPSLEGAPGLSAGRRLAMVSEELGPTFVKLGQMVSTRPDLVPAEIVAELAKLQDQVPPFDTAEARKIIAADLGAPVDQCFAAFEDQPFASGSVAQVYRATTKADGDKASRSVVVKVKRPGIEDVVRLDMSILRWVADLAERLPPEFGFYQPRTIVDEFDRTMMREMDFITEASTMTRFAEAMTGDPCFRVPRVYWELTGPNVLTLERLQGVSAQKVLAKPDPAIDRRALANRIAQAFVRQFFEIGLFHADPHPGNLLIQPPASVGLIDFGLTGQIDDEMLGQLVIALMAAFNREPEVLVEVLADMGALDESTDRRQLRREFGELIEKYYGLPLRRFDLTTVFYEITGLVRRNQVTLPREFVLMGKALVAVSGLCLQLDPQLDLVALVKPSFAEVFSKRLAPARLLKSAAISGWHMFNLLRNAPGQMRDIFRRLASGQWQLHVRHQNLDDLATEIDRASNRLGFAVIIGSIIVGSSLVLSVGAGTILGVPLRVFGVAGYLVAGVMGLWLAVAILRSGKMS